MQENLQTTPESGLGQKSSVALRWQRSPQEDKAGMKREISVHGLSILLIVRDFCGLLGRLCEKGLVRRPFIGSTSWVVRPYM